MTNVKNADLVLQIPSECDTYSKLDEFDEFLDALIDDQHAFLREAVITALKYLLNPKFANLGELIAENIKINPNVSRRYIDNKQIEIDAELSCKKSCSLDLATGTGKSFAIFALAQIALSLKLVDKVLVLCPSLTIEAELKKKFSRFIESNTLMQTIPTALRLIPRIVNANQTVGEGDICVENIHAAYQSSLSSIRDSFVNQGTRTLVINDEAHHIFNSTSSRDSGKEWKKFLISSDFNFNYIINLTGTAFIKDTYFHDVVYRFSINQAIEANIVKKPLYLIDSGSEKAMSNFDEIYTNHEDNKQKYNKVKPITLIVTSDISTCYDVFNKLQKYLGKRDSKHNEERVIWVASSPPKNVTESERLQNIKKLANVDSSENPVEWIVSVSMLTEGWDVKNIFQIVPHESRAFNSKLLISQVLGRGLRIPEIYASNEELYLTIYNHIKFSSEIQDLFKDLLEVEDRLTLTLDEKKTFHFNFHNLDYVKDFEVKQTRTATNMFSEKIALQPQNKFIANEITYQRALSKETITKSYQNEEDLVTLYEASVQVWSVLNALDLEQNRRYAQKYTLKIIANIIKSNLLDSTQDFISIENLNRVKNSFRKLYDQGGSTIFYKNRPDQIIRISTEQLPVMSCAVSSFHRFNVSSGKLFFSINYPNSLNQRERGFLDKIRNDEEEMYAFEEVTIFKSPQLAIKSSHSPERIFLKKLLKSSSAKMYESFIKSPDMGFYSLPYSFKKGTHMKYLSFNPDFFIKIANTILVVEIKSDTEDSNESRAKLRDAKVHFKKLNESQDEVNYIFLMLSPSDFEAFFSMLDSGKLVQYDSDLMLALNS